MNHREITGVEDRREVAQRGIERREPIPEPDGVGIFDRHNVRLPAGARVIERRVHRHREEFSVRVVRAAIARVEHGHDVVDSVIAAAEEEENQFLVVDPDAAFGERAFEERRDIHQRSQAESDGGAARSGEERTASDDVWHNDSIIVPGNEADSEENQPCCGRGHRRPFRSSAER
jgi:hypothetical protein